MEASVEHIEGPRRFSLAQCLFNPFERIAGFHALVLGLGVI